MIDNYYNNLIEKTNTDNSTSYYDVVNGQLSLIYNDGDANTNIKRLRTKSNCYLVVSKDDSNSYYVYKVYAYGSKTALTLYSDSQSNTDFTYIYDNDDYSYYTVSNLYTDTDLTKNAPIIKFGRYTKNVILSNMV